MSAEPNLECAVRALRDHLTVVAEALVRGEAEALERLAPTTAKLAATMGLLLAGEARPPVDPFVVSEARWALLRCQRLGITASVLTGRPEQYATPPTYLPSGARSFVSSRPTAFEVSV